MKKSLLILGIIAIGFTSCKKEIEKETGIKPFKGILDKPGMLDVDNDIVIDDLPLDYSIID